MELTGPILPGDFEIKKTVKTLVRASRIYSVITPTTYACRALKIFLCLSVSTVTAKKYFLTRLFDIR